MTSGGFECEPDTGCLCVSCAYPCTQEFARTEAAAAWSPRSTVHPNRRTTTGVLSHKPGNKETRELQESLRTNSALYKKRLDVCSTTRYLIGIELRVGGGEESVPRENRVRSGHEHHRLPKKMKKGRVYVSR